MGNVDEATRIAIEKSLFATIGFGCGLAVGTATNAFGGGAGVLVTEHTRIPVKVTALVGSMGTAAALLHGLGHSPHSTYSKRYFKSF
jgi:hypothetical protein